MAALDDEGIARTFIKTAEGRVYSYATLREPDVIDALEVKGRNVFASAKEVESELDAVQGVFESAIFGVPHPDFGEGVTAVLVAKPGAKLSERDIIDSIKQRLAAYKLPKRVLLIDELPRNTMGKVQKNALRNIFAALYTKA